MKKIFGALALTALLFTGCIKGDDTYEERRPIIPGYTMYTAANNQNVFALQPADAGMRFAILFAEAAKQGKTDLTEVLDGNNKSVLTQLFESGTVVEQLSETGDYKITFTPNSQYTSAKGSLIIHTGGLQLAETTLASAWSVEITDDFQLVGTLSSGMQQIVEYAGGTSLYANGDGSYSIVLDRIATNVKDSSLVSAWSGSYRIRPDATSLAFSECHGKDFTVAGSMGGTSMHSLANPANVATDLSISLSNVKYMYAGQLFTGTVVVRLNGFGDYDASYYVSPTATLTFALDANNRLRCTIEYNGHTQNI